MFKIRRTANGDVVLAVIGQLEASNVGELSALLAEEQAGRTLVLDLQDLILVDCQVIRFLRKCEAQGIALRNCPGYIRFWIASGKEDL